VLQVLSEGVFLTASVSMALQQPARLHTATEYGPAQWSCFQHHGRVVSNRCAATGAALASRFELD
jgi:hypothetical protein